MADGDLDRLTGLLEEMAKRLAELERRRPEAEPLGRSLSQQVAEELRAGRHSPPAAVVLSAGSFWPTGSVSFNWEERRSLEDLLTIADASLAGMLAAFAHPARVALVKTLLTGERSAGELMAGLGLRTTGQLYHHLNDLIGAGVVLQRSRNRYGLNPGRVRLVLAILVVGAEIGAAGPNPAQASR